MLGSQMGYIDAIDIDLIYRLPTECATPGKPNIKENLSQLTNNSLVAPFLPRFAEDET